MKYNIDVEKKGSVLFLRPTDRDLGAEEAKGLKAVLNAKLEKDTRGVVINLSLAEYLSSVFLSALIEILKELNGKGVKLALAGMNLKILEILKVTKLDTAFYIFENSSQAYEDFKTA